MTKYPRVHNNASSSETKIHQHIYLEMFWIFKLVNRAWSVRISLLIQIRFFFSLEKAIHEEMIHILAWSNGLKFKQFNDGFVSNTQLFALQDFNWWTEGWVNFKQIFIFEWTISLTGQKGCRFTTAKIISWSSVPNELQFWMINTFYQ